MSHASGMVRFPDGTVMHFEYNGTVDVVVPSLWLTAKERDDHWRSGEWRECTCGGAPALVEIFSDYGVSHWAGTACRTCRCVVDGISAYDIEQTDGTPSWVTAYRMAAGHPEAR